MSIVAAKLRTKSQAKTNTSVPMVNGIDKDGKPFSMPASEYIAQLNPQTPTVPVASVLQLVNPLLPIKEKEKKEKKEFTLKNPDAPLSFNQSRAICWKFKKLYGQTLDYKQIAHFTMAQANEEIKKLDSELAKA